MYKRIGFVVLSIFTLVGCNSIRTTFLKPDGCGELVKDPHVFRHGIPVMVKVPTHIEVAIKQTDFWALDGNRLILKTDLSSRRPEIKELHTEKMVLVDPKRPASGDGTFKFAFASGDDAGKGYLTNATYKSVDSTFVDSAALLSTAISTFAAAGAKSIDQATAEPVQLMKEERTVAYKRFAIDDSTEIEIRKFLNTHINNCYVGCNRAPEYATEQIK